MKVGGNTIAAARVTEHLKAVFEKRQKKEIFIQADKSLSYGIVATVMAQAQAAGISRIGLVTEPKSGRSE